MAATKRSSRAKTSTTTRSSRDRRYGTRASQRVEKVMHETKHGTLRSIGSRTKITDSKRSIAISLNQARRASDKVPRRK